MLMVDESVGVCMYWSMNGCIQVWVQGCKYERILSGWAYIWKDVQTNGCTGGWMYRYMGE